MKAKQCHDINNYIKISEKILMSSQNYTMKLYIYNSKECKFQNPKRRLNFCLLIF